jgi:hypothetical protein
MSERRNRPSFAFLKEVRMAIFKQLGQKSLRAVRNRLARLPHYLIRGLLGVAALVVIVWVALLGWLFIKLLLWLASWI